MSNAAGIFQRQGVDIRPGKAHDSLMVHSLITNSALARLRVDPLARAEGTRMAKATLNGSQFSYEVAEGMTASCALNALFPGFENLPEAGRKAIFFSLKTAARNATSGKMSTPELIAEAFTAVSKRLASWAKGEWQAAREGGAAGESQTSVLVRAISRALGLTPEEAQELVSETIEEALDAAGLDRDSEDPEDKKKVRAVASSIRASLKAKVEKTYAAIQEEDKRAKAEKAVDSTEELRAMLKR
jgi:hypothetical protein